MQRAESNLGAFRVPHHATPGRSLALSLAIARDPVLQYPGPLPATLSRFIFLLLLGSGATAAVRAEDFPIKKFAAFTWKVDYEPFWSPDGKKMAFVSISHGSRVAAPIT